MCLTTGNMIKLKIPPSCYDCFGLNNGGIYIFKTEKEYFSKEDIENDILTDKKNFKICECIEQISFQEFDINSYEVVLIHKDKNDYVCSFTKNKNDEYVINKKIIYNNNNDELSLNMVETNTEESKNIRKAIANSKQSDKKN